MHISHYLVDAGGSKGVREYDSDSSEQRGHPNKSPAEYVHNPDCILTKLSDEHAAKLGSRLQPATSRELHVDLHSIVEGDLCEFDLRHRVRELLGSDFARQPQRGHHTADVVLVLGYLGSIAGCDLVDHTEAASQTEDARESLP